MFFRFIIAAILGICFLGWSIHHIFFKKDFDKYRNEFFFGLFFFGVWALIYWWMTRT